MRQHHISRFTWATYPAQTNFDGSKMFRAHNFWGSEIFGVNILFGVIIFKGPTISGGQIFPGVKKNWTMLIKVPVEKIATFEKWRSNDAIKNKCRSFRQKGILCNYLDCIWNMLTVELNDARKITIESEDILGKNLNPSLGLNVTLVQDQKTI